MTEKTISTDEAWDALCMPYDREAKRKANYEGRDWYQITPEEQQVFGLSLKAMPWVVTAYRFYEEILGLTDTGLLPPEIMAVIRKDLAERIGMEPEVISLGEFQKFARLLGISNRTAHVWYIKHEFWCVRRGITQYQDEKDGHTLNWRIARD